jgi:RNA polymerase sigma factor (sigma-70 family)
MPDDDALMAGMRDGDADCLGRIYERHKDSLITIARYLLADASAAEDALHDVFVSFATKARSLRLRGSLRGYLAAAVANRARDFIRRQARQSAALTKMTEPGVEAPPDSAITDCEDRERLQQALLELPYEQREVITLHLHGDMTFSEIGHEQGVSINTALSRYRYGLDRLRTILGGVRT